MKKKASNVRYYKNKSPKPLTDKQKIEILNTKITSAEQRASVAEESLQSFKSAKDFMEYNRLKYENEMLKSTVEFLRNENERLKAFKIIPSNISFEKNKWKFWAKK